MGNYKTCKYAILDTVWGEYKCKKKQHRLYDLKECNDCELFKPEKETQQPSKDA